MHANKEAKCAKDQNFVPDAVQDGSNLLDRANRLAKVLK